jgi:hypothetical protein
MNTRFKLTILTFCFLGSCASLTYAQQSPVITEKELLRIAPRPANQGKARNNQPPTLQAEASGSLSSEERRRIAEESWSLRLRITQEKVKELERRADVTEMEINRLKNVLYSGEPRPAKTHKELIAQVESQTAELRRLRAEAQIARTELADLLNEGTAAGFRTYSTATALQLGRGMSAGQYYRTRYAESKTELVDAERRADIIQLRINDLSRRILLNSGSGDEFYNTRLRDMKSDLELELSEELARIDAVNRKIEELRRQARAAGIYLNL